MPPGMPLIEDRIVATNFSGPKVQGRCEVPCRMALACVVAGAEDAVLRSGAAERHPEPAERREEDRPSLDGPAHAPGKAAARHDQDAAEHAAEEPARDAHHRQRDPLRPERQGVGRRAEIGVVADDRERREAGRDHGCEDQPARPRLEGAAHLLDAEDDAGQRRVERRRDAGRRTRDQEARLAMRREAAEREHHRGADLHGRTFATRRGPAGEPEQQQQDLARRHLQADQRAARRGLGHLVGRDDLRDAAAAGVREIAPGQPGREREAERRRHEGRQRPAAVQQGEQELRAVGQDRHGDREAAHRDAADEEEGPAPPARQPDANGPQVQAASEGAGAGGGRRHAPSPYRMSVRLITRHGAVDDATAGQVVPTAVPSSCTCGVRHGPTCTSFC